MTNTYEPFKKPTATDYYGFFSIEDLSELPAALKALQNSNLDGLFDGAHNSNTVVLMSTHVYNDIKFAIENTNIDRLRFLTTSFDAFVKSIPTDDDSLRMLDNDIPFIARVRELAQSIKFAVGNTLKGWVDMRRRLRYGFCSSNEFLGSPDVLCILQTAKIQDAFERVERIVDCNLTERCVSDVQSTCDYLLKHVTEDFCRQRYRAYSSSCLYGELEALAEALLSFYTVVVSTHKFIKEEILNEQVNQ